MRQPGVSVRSGLGLTFLVLGALYAMADGPVGTVVPAPALQPSGSIAEGSDAASGAAVPTRILSDATGGTFREGRLFWFSVPRGQRLRLVVDGAETYRGSGPASVRIDAADGEQRSYEILAQRLSAPPEDAVLEARSWSVLVDRRAPAGPLPEAAQSGGGWTLSFGGVEEGAAVSVALDADGYAQNFPDFGHSRDVNATRISGYAWTVDPAGNASAPVPFSYSPFSLDLVNPVPGTWANRQLLAVDARGAASVRWSLGDEDPLGPGGQDYRGPTLLDATGPVRVRLAARAPDGRLLRREVAYVVSGDRELSDLSGAQTSGDTGARSVPIPDGYAWDIGDARLGADGVSVEGGELRFVGATSVALRPVAGYPRWVALSVGRIGPFLEEGIPLQRYVFRLRSGIASDGGIPASGETGGAGVGSEGAGGSGEAAAPFSLLRTGAVRLLVPELLADERLRYRIDGAADPASWKEASAPIPLPQGACEVQWVADGGADSGGTYSTRSGSLAFASALPSSVDGAYAVVRSIAADAPLPNPGAQAGGVLPPSTVDMGASSGTVKLSAPAGAAFPRYSLSLSDDPMSPAGPAPVSRAAPVSERSIALDACDGEDLLWTVALGAEGDGERALLHIRVDRRPPAPPVLDAPEDGMVLSDAVLLAASSPEGKIRIDIVSDSESGERRSSRVWAEAAPLALEGERTGLVRYSVSAVAIDEAGNESAPTTRSFAVDAYSVYVSAASGRDVPGVGTRSNPFRDLSAALDYAARLSRTRVVVAGRALLTRPAVIQGSLTVEGGYDASWERDGNGARVEIAPDASLRSDGGLVELSALNFVSSALRSAPLLEVSGGSLALRRVEHRYDGDSGERAGAADASTRPDGLIVLQRGTSLAASDCTLISAGAPVLRARGADVDLRSVYLMASGVQAVALKSEGARMVLDSCRLETDPRSDRAILAELRDGSLQARSSAFFAVAGRSALALSAKDAVLDLIDVGAESRSGSYAQILDLQGGSLSWARGNCLATASNAVGLSLAATSPATLRRLSLELRGGTIVRALQADGAPLLVEDSAFVASGGGASGGGAYGELLSGSSARDWIVSGSSFSGFSLLLAGRFSSSELGAFNALFARGRTPNVVDGIAGQ